MKTCGKAQTESGSFRIIILLVVIMGMAFWHGGQGIYTALKNRRPVCLGVQDLAKGQPSAHWLILTNCEYAFDEAAWKITRSKYEPAGGGRITEGYIPLRVPEGGDRQKCYAVLATSDPATLGMLEELRQVNDKAGGERFVSKYASQLRQKHDVTGLVRFGIEKGSESGKLAGLQRSLAPGFIVLSEGKKPSLGMSVGLLLVGFIIAGGMVMTWRSNSEETTEQY
jgi:hypothetical protein